jgi:hypothetical protein
VLMKEQERRYLPETLVVITLEEPRVFKLLVKKQMKDMKKEKQLEIMLLAKSLEKARLAKLGLELISLQEKK